jgi:hypothetical protein
LDAKGRRCRRGYDPGHNLRYKVPANIALGAGLPALIGVLTATGVFHAPPPLPPVAPTTASSFAAASALPVRMPPPPLPRATPPGLLLTATARPVARVVVATHVDPPRVVIPWHGTTQVIKHVPAQVTPAKNDEDDGADDVHGQSRDERGDHEDGDRRGRDHGTDHGGRGHDGDHGHHGCGHEGHDGGHGGHGGHGR